MEVNNIKIEIRKHHITPGINVLDLVVDVDGNSMYELRSSGQLNSCIRIT